MQTPAIASAVVAFTVRLAERRDAGAIRAIYNLEVTESTVTFDLVPRTLDEQVDWIDAHSGAHPAVVDGTPGPLVDGTEYRSPEFAEQAKEYHQRVLIAHKEHAAVEVPLPTLNGQTSSPAGLAAAEKPPPTGPPPGPGRADSRRSRGNSRRKKKT